MEDALARADHHLERGRVKEALDELEQVEGYSQVGIYCLTLTLIAIWV